MDVSDLLKEKQNLRAKKSYEKRKRERKVFSKIQAMKTMNRRGLLKGVNIIIMLTIIINIFCFNILSITQISLLETTLLDLLTSC